MLYIISWVTFVLLLSEQYNCNQERIENNQLIGFTNARPSTGIYRIAIFAQSRPFQRQYQDIVILSSM